MKFGTAIGIVISIVGIAIGATMEGTNVMVVLNIPAISIVLIGTLGATIAGLRPRGHIRLPAIYKKAILPDDLDLPGRVKELVGFAEQARRDGLLALDEAARRLDDPYTARASSSSSTARTPTSSPTSSSRERGDAQAPLGRAQAVRAGRRLAPTMGIIGTVFGLVHVLEQPRPARDARPAISAAFIATLIGVARRTSSSSRWPNRLKQLSEAELHFRAMTLEGILAIQAGDNPRVVEEKLMAYVRRRRTGPEAARAAAAAEKQAA
jgi:chemotaxis protein MotA